MTANTFLSVHRVTKLRAHTLAQLGVPLVLTFESDAGTIQLTAFFRNEDADKMDRIASAIEGAQGPIYNPPHNHDEAAAYVAQTALFGDER